jgi:hypothetical protein
MVDALPEPEMDVYEYILKTIESVPHLEALVLLWNSRPVMWSIEELASRLYLPHDDVQRLVRDLVRLRLAAHSEAKPTKYSYLAVSPEQDQMMFLVDSAYRRDVVLISTLIHNKASSAIHEFARAFRLKREQKG